MWSSIMQGSKENWRKNQRRKSYQKMVEENHEQLRKKGVIKEEMM